MESNGIPVDSMDRNRSRINRKKSEKINSIGKNRKKSVFQENQGNRKRIN